MSGCISESLFLNIESVVSMLFWSNIPDGSVVIPFLSNLRKIKWYMLDTISIEAVRLCKGETLINGEKLNASYILVLVLWYSVDKFHLVRVINFTYTSVWRAGRAEKTSSGRLEIWLAEMCNSLRFVSPAKVWLDKPSMRLLDSVRISRL